MDKVYRKTIEDIKVQGENFADSAMKGVYLKQKQALDELHNQIGRIYIDYSKDGLLNLTTTQESTITANIKSKLKSMGLDLGKDEVAAVTGILGDVFKTTYYKNAFVLDSGVTGNIEFDILKPEFIDAAVNQKFKDELFSDRIWANKADMIDKLQASIIEAMKGNTTIDKIGRDIRDRFNVTAYESQRLVQTETARIQSQASDDIATSTGVSQQLYSATLDNKTSEECSALDGTIYDIDDPDKVVPPDNHPNCRCCLINIPYEGWTATQRKDNETGDLIDNTTYDQWLKDKGVES